MMMHAASLLGNRCTLPSDADFIGTKGCLQLTYYLNHNFAGALSDMIICSAIKETDVLHRALRLGKDPRACLHCLFYTSHCAMQSPVLMKPVPCWVRGLALLNKRIPCSWEMKSFRLSYRTIRSGHKSTTVSRLASQPCGRGGLLRLNNAVGCAVVSVLDNSRCGA